MGLAIHELYQECVMGWGSMLEDTVREVFDSLLSESVKDAIEAVCAEFPAAKLQIR